MFIKIFFLPVHSCFSSFRLWMILSTVLSYVRSFVRLFVFSFVLLFVCPFVRLWLILSTVLSYVRSFVCLLLLWCSCICHFHLFLLLEWIVLFMKSIFCLENNITNLFDDARCGFSPGNQLCNYFLIIVSSVTTRN